MIGPFGCAQFQRGRQAKQRDAKIETAEHQNATITTKNQSGTRLGLSPKRRQGVDCQELPHPIAVCSLLSETFTSVHLIVSNDNQYSASPSSSYYLSRNASYDDEAVASVHEYNSNTEESN